jgi:hypothetical protein
MRLCLPIVLALLGATPVLADDLTVKNGTDGDVVSLFVSDLGGAQWGQDQLDDPLEPGASVTVKGLEPGRHRVRVIDEDDAECVIDNIDVQGSTTWTLTDEALDECQASEDGSKGAEMRKLTRPTWVQTIVSLPGTGQARRFGLE